MEVHVYAGPTVPRADILKIVPNAIIQPPVAHGDLLRVQTEALGFAMPVVENCGRWGCVWENGAVVAVD